MYKIIRFFLFLLPAETAHIFTLNLLRFLHQIKLLKLFLPSISEGSVTQAFGLTFKNPVGIAAGLDKNGDYIDCLAALGVGFIEVGAVTPKAQPGNPKPRLFRLKQKSALINRMGFNNKGVDYLVNNLKKRKTKCIVGVNIGKNKSTPLVKAKEDYLICLEKVYCHTDFVTLNISSPNTLGLRELQGDTYLHDLLSAIKTKKDNLYLQYQYNVPILVKISPDLSQPEIIAILETIVSVGLDGIIATNASQYRAKVNELPLSKEAGGLSGSPIAELSFKALSVLENQAAKTLDIISVGGINSASEAMCRFSHGAKLIQIYTALIYQGPRIIKECIRSCKS